MPRLRKADKMGKEATGTRKKKNPPHILTTVHEQEGAMKSTSTGAKSEKSTKRVPLKFVEAEITKRRKKGMEVHPLWNDPPDDAYAPFFQEFQSKRAPNFTPVEDLILCKSYAAVSEDPTVGTDQTVETFWGKIFETFIYLSATEASNGTFYKQNGKSMRDCFVRTIQPAMNVFNKHFCDVKNRKISGIGGEEDIYNIALKEYEEAEGKPFPFLSCAKSLHKMPRFNPMTKPTKLRLADNSVVSKGEVNNIASPMGSSFARPKGVKATKNHVEISRMKHMTTKGSAESMSKMASSHTKIAAVMVHKQQFAENQAKIAGLWKLHSYYQSLNNKSKVNKVMEKLEKLIGLDDDVENKEDKNLDGDDNKNEEALDGQKGNNEINDNDNTSNSSDDDDHHNDCDEESGDDVEDKYDREEDSGDDINEDNEDDEVDDDKDVNNEENDDNDDISSVSGGNNVDN